MQLIAHVYALAGQRFQMVALALPLVLLSTCGPRRYVPDRQPEAPQQLDAFLEEAFLSRLDDDPALASRLGRGRARSRLPGVSVARAVSDQALRIHDLERLRDEVPVSALEAHDELAFRLVEWLTETRIAGFEWRHQQSLLGPGLGAHLVLPDLLLDAHAVSDAGDAEDYIARLAAAGQYLDQVAERLEENRARGVLHPRYVYSAVIEDCRTVIRGAPIDAGASDGLLMVDFRTKLDRIRLPGPDERRELLRQAQEALVTSVGPGYERLIAVLEEQAQEANDDVGAWRLPQGEPFYRYTLSRATSLDLTIDEVERLALREVRRVEAILQVQLDEFAFEGQLEAFFDRLRNDPGLAYRTEDEGRLLESGRTTLQAVKDRAGELLTLPPGRLELIAVAPQARSFRPLVSYRMDDTATEPNGAIRINPRELPSLPRYSLATLLYREGLPGRHARAAVIHLERGLPSWVRTVDVPVTREGWAQYAELLPGELGLETTVYGELGRLTSELWHAACVVADVGIHARRWNRERAIAYLVATTPRSRTDCERAVDRSIFEPGAVAAGLVGRVRIQRMRDRAAATLGDRFDRVQFHDALLRAGPLPLDLLETVIEEWVESQS